MRALVEGVGVVRTDAMATFTLGRSYETVCGRSKTRSPSALVIAGTRKS